MKVLIKRVPATFILLLVSIMGSAQFIINSPSKEKQESNEVTLDALRFYPDSVVLDMSFHANKYYKDQGFYINPTSHIQFAYGPPRLLGSWSSTITQLLNAQFYATTYVKKGKSHRFSMAFPFSVYKLLGSNKVDKKAAFTFFSLPDPLSIDFINCDNSYRAANNIPYGKCFDVYHINTNMPLQNWATLWCHGYLSKFLEKDEFETTATYNARTSPEKMAAALHTEIMRVHEYLIFSTKVQTYKNVPVIKYDSDTETFNVVYTGAEPISFKIALSQAPAFKQKLAEKKLTIYDLDILYSPNGTHYIRSIRYEDKSSKTEIQVNNINKPTGDPFKEFENAVMTNLRNYPKFKNL